MNALSNRAEAKVPVTKSLFSANMFCRICLCLGELFFTPIQPKRNCLPISRGILSCFNISFPMLHYIDGYLYYIFVSLNIDNPVWFQRGDRALSVRENDVHRGSATMQDDHSGTDCCFPP